MADRAMLDADLIFPPEPNYCVEMTAMSSDACGCCGHNMCRSPKDDDKSNWLCQECIDRCPDDDCLVRPPLAKAQVDHGVYHRCQSEAFYDPTVKDRAPWIYYAGGTCPAARAKAQP